MLATPELLQPVADTLEWLIETMTAVINHGVDAREFPADVDLRRLASIVVAIVRADYVLARAQNGSPSF